MDEGGIGAGKGAGRAAKKVVVGLRTYLEAFCAVMGAQRGDHSGADGFSVLLDLTIGEGIVVGGE